MATTVIHPWHSADLWLFQPLPWGGNVVYTEQAVLFALNNVFLILTRVTGMFLYVSVTKPYEMVQSFQPLHLPFKAGFAFATALQL